MAVGILRHTYASGLFEGGKGQSERNVMYAHLDVLSARSKAVKRRVQVPKHDGIRVRFRSRSASFPPYVRSFFSPEFLCKMDNEIRGRQNVLFLPPVHKSLGSQ